ncbi:MAG: hypothetical protein DME66_04150 [Verrucomicrobia bacterium]|nr:MAG: hypothetical protein DME66_04150 [Verrucomicrobiota bacterium]
MSSDNPEETGQQSHARRLHFNPCEKLREAKSDWSVKVEIENSFDFARLISGFDGRNRRLDLLGH